MLNQEILEEKLANLPLGRIIFRGEVDSTNILAASLLGKGLPDASLVVANHQTKGRGRSGRKWFTPPDTALAFTYVIKKVPSQLENGSIPLFSGLGALAVCKALEEEYSLQPKIKWPNDILLDGKKTCGILAEAHWKGSQLQAVIIGIGINVSPSSIPDEKDLNFPATCIENHINKPAKDLELLRTILVKVLEEQKRITTPNFIQDWENRLAFMGQKVKLLEDEKNNYIGIITGLDADGRLILKLEDGSMKRISIGEISLRPFVDR